MLEIKDPFVGTHREQIPEENAEGAIPGYKGFIRGSQHFYGSTYGRMSRRASAHEFGPDPEGNPVDEVPHGISGALKMGSTFPSTEGEGDDREAKYRLPGYAGYVPGSKFEFASTRGPGRQKRATTCPTSKAPISAVRQTTNAVGDLRSQVRESPKKPRMLATVTTEMLNGTNTVVFDRTPKALRDARSVDLSVPVADVGNGNIPGYAGFIRGAQHFYGSTYSNMTRVAKEMECDTNEASAAGGHAAASRAARAHGPRQHQLPADRPPGYSGHVPLSKFEYANTFAATHGLRTRNATAPPLNDTPMGIIPFPVCRVGVSSERRKKLDALARALREARDGGADAARLLRDLFSARTGSDGQRRAAKRLINAWNRIVVDGRAVEERLRRAATKRKAAGVSRRRGGEEEEEEEWRDDAPVSPPRRRRWDDAAAEAPEDDDDEDDVAVFPGGEEAEWSE
ncbi:hypothetical protein JL722_2776 [Aureococcus anophagefferens]|nr:hypothetical protein JL722_2776 [Aureococcus anophagefferens]